jgi:hypothetical protein
MPFGDIEEADEEEVEATEFVVEMVKTSAMPAGCPLAPFNWGTTWKIMRENK